MKLVVRYTLVLVAILGLVLALLTIDRTKRDRARFEADMTNDHRVVGHVLQVNAIDLWRAAPPMARARSIDRLIERANETAGAARFEWHEGRATLAETAGVEGHDFVSRFPVRVDGDVIGAIVVREPLDATDHLVQQSIVFSAISVGLIVALSLVTSLVLGRWLVGKPIGELVEMARRVGRRDFSGAVELHRTDELGQLAAAMNAMSTELEQALAQITLETDARVRAVEQMRHAERLSTVGQLAAGVAHELGTPLSIVAGHAQMIAGNEVTGDAVRDSARAIDHEATRMSRIVRQLLDFARRRGPEGTVSDVQTVVERCVGLLAPLAHKTSIAIDVAIAGPLRVVSDEDSLQQVLTNLIVNGLQAMPAGGTLRIAATRELAAPREPPSAAPRPCVRIDVTDTGGGIPGDTVDHIFEPFFTTKQPGDGTGLGLAVVYGIVVDHGGWITVDTSERGTTFSIFLQEAAA
ncbi:MAG TPA: ATP-binding protein [Kofleriaceae bacterium]|nr:ATP-binding protein [Kofleriaceae bacterium]